MNPWVIGGIALVAVGFFFWAQWWVTHQSGKLKAEEKALHDEATAHAEDLTKKAAERHKVAAAKPVGSSIVEKIRARVRKKRGK